MGTKNTGLAYGDLLGRTTHCSNNLSTIFRKIISLGGAHRYGDERTVAGSDNSISYGAQSAIPRADEKYDGNSAKIELVLTSLDRPSHTVAKFDSSWHSFCK